MLEAIFKALGVALAQACDPTEGGDAVADKAVVRTEAAPAPFQGAPYSQAIRAGGFVFVSGQLALKPGRQGALRRHDRGADRAGLREPRARSSRRRAPASTGS